ncbi:MAG: FAD-dependent oxidoreductase [Flavobacteriaceae bacterium]|nr:FAD-binding oxidoreductase [Bacteroidia bacterium]NNK83364.1 FAD-dependent oxidoreductase [Flavobacteriaceae bacterium]
MKVDFIVVGSGLAGTLFCEVLRQQKKTFMVIDDNSQKSSVVAGGLYNPVILKRFSSVWKSKEQLKIALPTYKNLEDYLDLKLDYKIPVLRLFSSIEEQNNWFSACDNPKLSEYLKPKIISYNNKSIHSEFGFGEVLQTGRIDTKKLIEAFKAKLNSEDRLLSETCNYDNFKLDNNKVNYKHIESKHIVFSEGFGLKKNPFFNYLPINGTKGELLIIQAPDLKLEYVLKSSVFLIPIGDDKYIVGATYEWKDKSNIVTVQAKEELLSKLNSFIKCDYKVVDQIAGIRPTVKDRRPLVGQHPEYKQLYILNGLGTRGVMIAPYVAHQLFNFIENNSDLDSEIDIRRFKELKDA